MSDVTKALCPRTVLFVHPFLCVFIATTQKNVFSFLCGKYKNMMKGVRQMPARRDK